MAGTTTYYGISYPTSTDYVKDGATAMQTIATGFDSAVAIPTYNNQTGTSYTFVLADTGKTVTSNNAAAVTFTIPPQVDVAWANNATLTVRNLGAGVVTIAGGAGVTVTNTAQTVAQYGEVKLIRTASNAWTVVPASGGASGLTLITTASFTTQTDIQVDNCFTSTYDNYKVIFTMNTASVDNSQIRWQLVDGTTPTTTGYYYGLTGINFGNTAVINENSGGSGTTSAFMGRGSTNSYMTAEFDIFRPQLAQRTTFNTMSSNGPVNAFFGLLGTGWQDSTTQFEGIKFLAASGNITGTYWIYGFAKA